MCSAEYFYFISNIVSLLSPLFSRYPLSLYLKAQPFLGPQNPIQLTPHPLVHFSPPAFTIRYL
jgi:hypothetical protein